MKKGRKPIPLTPERIEILRLRKNRAHMDWWHRRNERRRHQEIQRLLDWPL